MNALINKLQTICKEHPLKEKLLIVDSYSIGKEIKQAYVNEWGHVIHLKIKTVYELAVDVIEQFSNKRYTLLEHAVGVQLMNHILKQLNENKQLVYFRNIEITQSFSRSMYESITQLRLAGYSSKSLLKDAFVSQEKADDFILMMNRYEEVLEENKLMDEADLLRQASNLAQPKRETVFILQSNLSLTQLAHDFLQKLFTDHVYKLPLPFVYGVTLPERNDLRSIEWSDATPFSYLYHLEILPEEPNLTLFTAKTEEVEIKHVFEQIKQLDAPLDHSVIYYTKIEPYVTTVFQLAEKYQIPITFGEGLSILYSRPGRLVAGIMHWIKENYCVSTFIHMMNEGLILLPDEAPSNSKISRYLREAQVGWSQSRYSSQLERLKNQVQQKQAETKDKEQYDRYQKKINEISWIQSWFEQLFKNLPIVENEWNYDELLTGLAMMLEKQSKTSSILDELAKEELLKLLKLILPYAKETLNQFEAFEKVKELLLKLRVNQSGPKPGCLHMSSYKKGIYNNRKNVFIVGLDHHAFPGAGSEDPLLLDEERSELSDYLPIFQEKGNENFYTMLQLLSQTQGSVSFSYCSFAMNDNRTVNPAHIFLQGYRMVTNPQADFKTVKKLPSPFSATLHFEDKDYWSVLLQKRTNFQFEKELEELYPNLIHGEAAERARKAGNFTHFDGRVNIDASLYDPRINNRQILSSEKLEKLATCPYAYFLKNILHLKPIEETIYDPYTWIDAQTRGSMLHRIFETFYRTLDGEKPVYEKHEKIILQIAEEKLTEQKQLFEPPSQRVFEREVNDIYQSCRIFLKEEEIYSKNYQAKHFEYAFGVNGAEPAQISLPSGETIQIRGMIDRVDQANEGYFHIIDYKTGSTYSYHDRNYFHGGRQLQHFIYALAIEDHLKLEAGTVKESTYYFPSVKGLGERFVRKQDDVMRTNGFDLLEKLIEVIKSGHFSMTDNESDCKFCHFKAVCRRTFYSKDILEQKQGDYHAEGIVKFKGVRAYD